MYVCMYVYARTRRLILTVCVATYITITFCGIGVWLAETARGLLSKQYGAYVGILARVGDAQVDWVSTARAQPGRLLTMQEYIVLFCARTAPLGTPFYMEMSYAVVNAAMVASYGTTVVFVIAVIASFAATRGHISAMRRGVHIAKVARIKLSDSSAYMGTQACAAAIGWLINFVALFCLLLVYLWPPLRFGYDDFMRAGWGTVIPIYFCTVVFARTSVRLYPGIIVQNRPLWAMNEFLLLIGAFSFSYILFLAARRKHSPLHGGSTVLCMAGARSFAWREHGPFSKCDLPLLSFESCA